MTDLKRTVEFDKWLKGLKDTKARAKVLVRLQRLEGGNPGEVRPAGDGMSEMVIDYGPGYRVYFKTKGHVATAYFGGDKSTQAADIAKAKKIEIELED
jgi:putative addiction module killer protein